MTRLGLGLMLCAALLLMAPSRVHGQCEEMRCRTCLQVAVNAIYNALPFQAAHRDCCKDVNKVLQFCDADDSQTAPQGQADVINPNYGAPYCTLVGNHGRGYSEADKAKCVKGVKYIRMCGACKVMPPHKTPCPPMGDFLKCQCYAAECLLSSKKYALYLEKHVRQNKDPLSVIADVKQCERSLQSSTNQWVQHIKNYYQPSYVDATSYRKKCRELMSFCDICKVRERDFALLGPPKAALAPRPKKDEPKQLYEEAKADKLIQISESSVRDPISYSEYDEYYAEEKEKDLRLGANILMELKEGIMSAEKACDPNFCRHVHLGGGKDGKADGSDKVAGAGTTDLHEILKEGAAQKAAHEAHEAEEGEEEYEAEAEGEGEGEGAADNSAQNDGDDDDDPNADGNDESIKEIEAAEQAIGKDIAA